MERPIHTETIQIPSYANDKHNILTPSAFMDLSQQIAGKHSDLYGFGRDALLKDGQVWIVSRIHIKFVRPTKWNDVIELSTWHKGCEDGLFYRREYKAVNKKDGEVDALSTASWLLFNPEKRSLVRRNPLCSREETIHGENAIEEPCERLKMPEGSKAEFAVGHTIRRSDIDRNGHANNAKYAIWSVDALPEGCMDREISDFKINFTKEVILGDTVDIFIAKEDEDTYFVEGKSKGLQTFISKIILI